MDNEEQTQKKGLHIHLGGAILLVIILLILFKVDIKSKINSPQFQKNITYIEEFFTNLWEKTVKTPLEKGVKGISDNLVNSGINMVQENVNEKLDGMKK